MFRYLIFVFLLLTCLSAHSQSSRLPLEVNANMIQYTGNKPNDKQQFTFVNNRSSIKLNNVTWQCEKKLEHYFEHAYEGTYTFKVVNGQAKNAGVSLNFVFKNWDKGNYVIMPSAVYDGNRFDVLKYNYPPLFKPEDYKLHMPITITDIPRLNNSDGESRLDLNTGDVSTPALGIYFPKTGKGIWIITEQATEKGNSVLTLRENADRNQAEFIISAPGVRDQQYAMAKLSTSTDTGADFAVTDSVTVRYKIYTFDKLTSPKDLNNKFLSLRKSYGKSTYIDQLPFSKAFELMEIQENQVWDEDNNFYTLGGNGWNTKWQLGWVGGGMVTYPLSLLGSQLSKDRAFRNYDRIIKDSQAGSGFYYSCGTGDAWCSDCFSNPHPDNLLLLRKNSDALYFFYKYCTAKKNDDSSWQMPTQWKTPLKNLSQAFVDLWNNNGQWGQFIDIENAEIKVGGSNSAVMAIGGLALAAKFENKPAYLKVAKEAARYYYNEYTVKGISCGGPGEILQNNDAESAFAMLESFMILYEVTNQPEWLKYAEDAAAFCSTWIVDYDYAFPTRSLFGTLDMKTTGVVWANTQNKHGGPGICTLSGDCLFKLYRATGNELYLGMIHDIAHNIMQYIARQDRPIKDQHVGWINERVNLSDWEGKGAVGDIFHGNTWAQVSAMLTVTEIPGIYINTKNNEMKVFDHVDAVLSTDRLTISNPTKFDANVRVFVDHNPAKPYPQAFISTLPKVKLKAGETKEIRLANLKPNELNKKL